MRCPACGCYVTSIIDSRKAPRSICFRRKRKCLNCENKFFTNEMAWREKSNKDSDTRFQSLVFDDIQSEVTPDE